MADSRRDHDTHAGFDRNDFVIELHSGVGAAVEEVIGLGEALMVMEFGLGGDGREVDGAGVGGDIGEGSASGSTGAGNAGELFEIDETPRPFCDGVGHGVNDSARAARRIRRGLPLAQRRARTVSRTA